MNRKALTKLQATIIVAVIICIAIIGVSTWWSLDASQLHYRLHQERQKAL